MQNKEIPEVVLRGDVCRNLMLDRKCDKDVCKYIHDRSICFHHWKFDKCKYGDECKKKHLKYTSKYDKNKEKKKLMLKKKNTETFEPMTKPVDARIVLDLGNKNNKLSTELSDRDILLVPNLFDDFEKNDIYKKLKHELDTCGIPIEKLFKLWHGDTHLIADDIATTFQKSCAKQEETFQKSCAKQEETFQKSCAKQLNNKSWKENMPTFNLIIERIKHFFDIDIKATRLNLYKDTSQWKPYHFDAASVKPEKASVQNFTIGVSFGECRTAAFERDTNDKTVISFPLQDGYIYAFSSETNNLWRHGILQELPAKENERISIIAWGWVNNIKKINDQ